MGQKILIALDGSEGAWRQVTLFHVLPGLPPEFWDYGHILDQGERETLQRVVADWERAQEEQWRGLVDRARARMVRAGVREEAGQGRFDTIVMGRRGLGKVEGALLGSVSGRVVQSAQGCAVTVVG